MTHIKGEDGIYRDENGRRLSDLMVKSLSLDKKDAERFISLTTARTLIQEVIKSYD